MGLSMRHHHLCILIPQEVDFAAVCTHLTLCELQWKHGLQRTTNSIPMRHDRVPTRSRFLVRGGLHP